MLKRWIKLFYDHIRVVVCEIPKNESFLKMVKIGHDANAIAFAKWSVWVKN